MDEFCNPSFCSPGLQSLTHLTTIVSTRFWSRECVKRELGMRLLGDRNRIGRWEWGYGSWENIDTKSCHFLMDGCTTRVIFWLDGWLGLDSMDSKKGLFKLDTSEISSVNGYWPNFAASASITPFQLWKYDMFRGHFPHINKKKK